jgi:hypothetical protein
MEALVVIKDDPRRGIFNHLYFVEEKNGGTLPNRNKQEIEYETFGGLLT